MVQLHLLLIVVIHYNRFHLTKFIIIQLQPIKLSYQQIINQLILHINYYYLYFIIIIIIQVHQNQINHYYLFLQPTLKLILLISFVMVHQIQKDFHLFLIIIVAIIY